MLFSVYRYLSKTSGKGNSIDLLLWAAIKYWPAFLGFLSLLYTCTSFSDGIFDPFRCWEDDTLSGTTPVSLGRHQSLSRSLQSIHEDLGQSEKGGHPPYLLAAAGSTQNHFPSILNAVDRGRRERNGQCAANDVMGERDGKRRWKRHVRDGRRRQLPGTNLVQQRPVGRRTQLVSQPQQFHRRWFQHVLFLSGKITQQLLIHSI